MLFLGSEKYPEEDAYRKYIEDNGGSCNAYTSYNDTNYMFDIKSEFLDGAIDRMANVFISPLFNEGCVEREMKAVNSENDRYKNLDNWRYWRLMESTCSPGHLY